MAMLVLGTGMLVAPFGHAQTETVEPGDQAESTADTAAPACVGKEGDAAASGSAGIIVRSSGPSAASYPAGRKICKGATIILKAGDVLTVLDNDGTRTLQGPGTFVLERRSANSSSRIASVITSRPTRRVRTGAVREGGSLPARTGIPAYPVWPPETPSSRVGLDRFIASRAGMSLYDAGEKLKGAFDGAGYVEHSYYAAPGGFVLVTRIEKIGADGAALKGAERYELPNQRSDPSLTDYVRNLFLEAPPGFYRYIAVVVSDRPFATSARTLDDDDAIARLRRGSNDLSAVYKTVPFTRAHKVEALIYEFRKDGGDGKVSMIEPGRIGAQIHLAKTGLDKSVKRAFGP
ncbi:MAG: hypothetical protein R3E02_08345 [Blastomonas sp.]